MPVEILRFRFFQFFLVSQVAGIQQLKTANPDGRYWIKLDATDIKAGVFESMKGVWNGDSDLGHGELQRLLAKYDYRKSYCTTALSTNGTLNRKQLEGHLRNLVDTLLDDDKPFLLKGLKDATEVKPIITYSYASKIVVATHT